MSSSRRFPQFDQDFDLQEVTTYHVGALESAAHRALRLFKDGLLDAYNLSGMQWYIIGAVQDAGEHGMRITDLSKQLGTTLGFMTNSVNLLESQGILQRHTNEGDSRSKFVVMKKSYAKTFTEIEQMLRRELRKTIYKDISPKELKAYIRTLHNLANID